ncbi:MAG: SDR family NAD(P)-dependent oxidoreductase [Nocardioidaceae bacterium]
MTSSFASLVDRTVDRVLDRSVVGGYTKLGYWARRHAWPDDDPRPGAMVDKTVLVTGASSGLGKAAAARLARLGATVHLLVRNEERGAAAREDLLRAVPDARLEMVRVDMADLDDVRTVGAALASALPRIDVLVHNAGVMPPTREETAQGHETTLAVHMLGPLLLTELLRGPLAAAHGRVVLVTSGGMYAQRLPAGDVEYTASAYKGATAYARSKRMQVALLPLMQERWAPDGIDVYAMHPGWADTPGVASSLPLFHTLTGPLLRDPDAGADTIVWLAATEPAPPGGRLWHDRAVRPAHYLRSTRETDAERQQVWQYCLAATGIAG